MSKLRTYAGTEATITWDQTRCIHAEECVRGSRLLFDPERKPWIEPDAASVEEAERVVARCPTGALWLRREDGTSAPALLPDNAVQVVRDGPLYVRGELMLEGEVPVARLALCRCGRSSSKPFCDGAHVAAEFRDSGAIAADPEGQAESLPQHGPLTILAAANGPLLLRGAHALTAASGRIARCGDKSALCRCGDSKNKPFCDGTHIAAGFQASAFEGGKG